MIEEIVARRDAAEHLLHALGRFAFGACAAGPSAGKPSRVFGKRSHELYRSIANSRFRQKAAAPQRFVKRASRAVRRPIRLFLFVAARPIVFSRLVISCHRPELTAVATRECRKGAAAGRRWRSVE